MKKVIKFLVVVEVLLLIVLCCFLFINEKISYKTQNLIKERHVLVNNYMQQHNLPIDEEIIVLPFLENKEQEKMKNLRLQYNSIDAQIYKKEKEDINNLKYKIEMINSFSNYMIYMFFILLSIIILYFIITKTPIKQIDFKNNLNQIIPIIVSIIFLSFAIFEIDIIEEDAFYSLLKIIVSATLFYISFLIKNSKSILFWLAISLGILFNPIVQIHLKDSDLWVFIDIATIIFLLIYSKNKFYINIKKQVLYELDLIQLTYKNNTRSYDEFIYSTTQSLFTTIKNKIKQHSVVDFKNKSNPKIIAHDIILNVCISELGCKGNRLWTLEENYIALLGKDCIDFFEKNGYYTRQQASSAFKELVKTFKGNKITDKDGKVIVTIVDGNRVNK